MEVIRTVAELRRWLLAHRRAGRRIGLVPTMGYLHAGHLALVGASLARCDLTVVSIFVNPAQFGAGEDLASYPRDLEADLEACRAAGVDVVFAPDTAEVYPPGFQTHVEPGPLALPLCGAFRPGHFRGVLTVVAKLFSMVGPYIAFFGQKDFQQSVLIRRMAEDLDFPVEVSVVATVRESDGIAMSSRNAYLDDEERRRARGLSRGLFAAQNAFSAGERRPSALIDTARAEMAEIDSVQYLQLLRTGDLQPFDSDVDAPAVLAVAGFVGGTRLIDNVLLNANHHEQAGR